MRILFAYFAFTEKNDAISPRPLGQCALNFSTTHTYAVHKEGEGEAAVYTVSRREKPENEKLPKDFWGDRIYNVSAIVGNNGSGKSTLLHQLIKAVVMGLEPDVPFLLALQMTGSEDLCLYCCKEGRFVWDGPEALTPQSKYPDRLKETKTMLLDNTLSKSSIELDGLYSSFVVNSVSSIVSGSNYQKKYVPENLKQFYNKSSFASIRYSNAKLIADKNKDAMPAPEAIAYHTRYETIQEIRLLFDRDQQENLMALEDKYFSIPRPAYLFIYVRSSEEQRIMMDEAERASNRTKNYRIPEVCHYLATGGLIGMVLENALLNLYSLLIDTALGSLKKHDTGFEYDFDSIFSLDDPFAQNHPSQITPRGAIEIAEKIICGAARDASKNPFEGARNYQFDGGRIIENWVERYRQFVQFISENENEMLDLFETFSSQQSWNYIIDINQTMSSPKKQRLFLSFLDFYQPISEPRGFLTFSSGMSSGEKNFLRMLTHFRDLLTPADPADPSKDHIDKYLQNAYLPFFLLGTHPFVCDTLFLFLDEVDLTYHPEWQRILISKLTAVLPRMFPDPYDKGSKEEHGCKDIQVILATHSPLMLGDFPKASVNYLQSNAQGITEIDENPSQSTFGENLYTILRDGFFMKDTVGEFAKKKITAAVKWCHAVRQAEEEQADERNDPTAKKRKEKLEAEYRDHYQTALLLPPGVIQNKLLSEMKQCADKLGIAAVGETKEEKQARLEKRLSEIEREKQEIGEALEELKKQDDQDS